MAKVNNCEMEIDAIRDKIYAETRHMTRAEQAKRLKDKIQALAAQYGFKIVASAKEKS
jgi:hypothetical protein